jgi:hypothetical protein
MNRSTVQIEELAGALSELDYVYQDGAIFNGQDVKKLEGISKHLAGIVKDLKVNSFGQVRE